MAVQEVFDANGNLISRSTPTAEDVNLAALTAQAIAAFEANRAAIARNTANVAAANPTTLPPVVAVVKDLLRQVSALEAQNNALMRLVLGLMGGTD